jgi:hypothetical protein
MELNIHAVEFVPSMEEFPVLLTSQLKEERVFDALEKEWLDKNMDMFEDSQEDLNKLFGPNNL